MSEERGIKELKEMVGFVVSIAEAVVGSLEDGKISFRDMFRLFGALKKAGPAIKGMGEMRLEIKDLSQAEKQELQDYVATEFDIENDILEGYIEQAMQAALLILDLISPMLKKKQ